MHLPDWHDNDICHGSNFMVRAVVRNTALKSVYVGLWPLTSLMTQECASCLPDDIGTIVQEKSQMQRAMIRRRCFMLVSRLRVPLGAHGFDLRNNVPQELLDAKHLILFAVLPRGRSVI